MYRYIFLVRLIYIFLVVCTDVFGTLIDLENRNSSVSIHCLPTKEVIQIKDPFNASRINEVKVIAMHWYKYSLDGSNEVPLITVMQGLKKIQSPRFSTFEFWGLQINNVSLNDSGIYLAKLVHLSVNEERKVTIIVADPPVMKSEKLILSLQTKKAENVMILSCGYFSSIGNPPGSIVMKTESGTRIPAVFKNATLQAIRSSKTMKKVKFTCGVDTSAPAAQCITDKGKTKLNEKFIDTNRAESMHVYAFGLLVLVVAVETA